MAAPKEVPVVYATILPPRGESTADEAEDKTCGIPQTVPRAARTRVSKRTESAQNMMPAIACLFQYISDGAGWYSATSEPSYLTSKDISRQNPDGGFTRLSRIR